MFSRPHTSWRKTVPWGRPSALWWWRRMRTPWHREAPPPRPSPRTETESRGLTRPEVGPSGNRREVLPGWRSSAHQTPGSPYPAPPASPEHREQQKRHVLIAHGSSDITMLNCTACVSFHKGLSLSDGWMFKRVRLSLFVISVPIYTNYNLYLPLNLITTDTST